ISPHSRATRRWRASGSRRNAGALPSSGHSRMPGIGLAAGVCRRDAMVPSSEEWPPVGYQYALPNAMGGLRSGHDSSHGEAAGLAQLSPLSRADLIKRRLPLAFADFVAATWALHWPAQKVRGKEL